MYKKFILATLLIVFSTAAANAGVTNIKEVVNNTRFTVRVSKGEVRERWNKNRRVNETFFSMKETTDAILENGTWSGDMWIPWVDNAEDFKNNVISISVSEYWRNAYFLLWQTGDAVRFTAAEHDRYGFIRNAPKVAGEAKVNGERRLIIGKENDKYVITLEKF